MRIVRKGNMELMLLRELAPVRKIPEIHAVREHEAVPSAEPDVYFPAVGQGFLHGLPCERGAVLPKLSRIPGEAVGRQARRHGGHGLVPELFVDLFCQHDAFRDLDHTLYRPLLQVVRLYGGHQRTEG